MFIQLAVVPIEIPSRTATALTHPNIALINYWGNRDDTLDLPAKKVPTVQRKAKK